MSQFSLPKDIVDAVRALQARVRTLETSRSSSVSLARKFSGDVGNGSATSIVVTHDLGTRDVIVSLYLNSGSYPRAQPGIAHTTDNTITLTFNTAPALNAYRVVVIA